MSHKVLITGGAGYVGTILVPQLLNAGHDVIVYDACYFGNFLPKNPKLNVIEADVRDTKKFAEACKGVDTVLHLACISNDPSFELDEGLSKTINYDCFEPMVIAAKEAGVKRFIYASSSSVYGVSDSPDVTEDHPLVPLTLYNKFKGMCEPLLFKHMSDDFVCVTIRPATICGYSPRMRLDLSVNILTNHAVNNRKITVLGGKQLRPNLHINYMADLYELLLDVSAEKIQGETFNAGYENMSIMDIAYGVKKIVEEEMSGEPIKIEVAETNDPRSYHINSQKIERIIGFKPKRSVEDAVRDLCKAFLAGKLPDSMTNECYFNVRTMKTKKAA